MKKNFTILCCMVLSLMGYSQGVNNLWLLGVETVLDPYTTSTKATVDFSSGSPNIIPTNRKMKFFETEGNIADINGNLLISSNGIWIANAFGDTMLNGSGLNPSPFTNSWSNYGLPIPNGNVILPYPGDSTKYILFHMTANTGANLMATELYYTVIDMTLDGGFGGVILKNQIAIQDTLSWGIGCCKHANGRDWWVTVLKDGTDIVHNLLLTPNGIDTILTQNLMVPPHLHCGTQPVFSPDGKKFAYVYSIGSIWIFNARIFDFDRCSGIFFESDIY